MPIDLYFPLPPKRGQKRHCFKQSGIRDYVHVKHLEGPKLTCERQPSLVQIHILLDTSVYTQQKWNSQRKLSQIYWIITSFKLLINTGNGTLGCDYQDASLPGTLFYPLFILFSQGKLILVQDSQIHSIPALSLFVMDRQPPARPLHLQINRTFLINIYKTTLSSRPPFSHPPNLLLLLFPPLSFNRFIIYLTAKQKHQNCFRAFLSLPCQVTFSDGTFSASFSATQVPCPQLILLSPIRQKSPFLLPSFLATL